MQINHKLKGKPGKPREGMAEYSWPPCNNYLKLPAFNFKNIIYIIYKTNYLSEEVNCTEPSIQLVFPGHTRVKWTSPCKALTMYVLSLYLYTNVSIHWTERVNE